MAKVIFGLTMSLDGFINDHAGSVEALYPDFATFATTAPMQEAINATGAVVMGWNTFVMAEDPDTYAATYEFQVPIFVLTHTIPQRQPQANDRLSFTFITSGIEDAIAHAKAAAGHKAVTIVGGASIGQQALRAGLVDEIQLDIMPILLGKGLRLFDQLDMDAIQLERLDVQALPSGRTYLRFRVLAADSAA